MRHREKSEGSGGGGVVLFKSSRKRRREIKWLRLRTGIPGLQEGYRMFLPVSANKGGQRWRDGFVQRGTAFGV